MSGILFEQLTDAQKEVADSSAPTILVLGGAGVGKTSYNQNLWIAHLSGGAAYLPR
jgi:hypothetical protein